MKFLIRKLVGFVWRHTRARGRVIAIVHNEASIAKCYELGENREILIGDNETVVVVRQKGVLWM